MIVVALVCPNQFSYIESYIDSENVAIYKAIQEAFKLNYSEEIAWLKQPNEYDATKEGLSYIAYCSSEIEGYILTKEV